jgi:hypothetical protein
MTHESGIQDAMNLLAKWMEEGAIVRVRKRPCSMRVYSRITR